LPFFFIRAIRGEVIWWWHAMRLLLSAEFG
jgi:hypothetical protein